MVLGEPGTLGSGAAPPFGTLLPRASGLPDRTRLRRFLLLIFWGGAAFQVVWIVLLYFQQQPRALGYHLRFTSFGITIVLVIGMLLTAWWCARNSHFTVLAATATATCSFITAWFSVFTQHGVRLLVVAAAAAIINLPIVLLCVWTVRRLYRPHGHHSAPPTGVPPVLVGAAVVLLVLSLLLEHHAPPIRLTFHLKIVWVGLDTLEWIGLVTTGWCLYRRRPTIAIAGAYTGMLLFCDAWFNVVASSGKELVAAIVMAFAELPMSALGFWVARREVLWWPEASPRAPSGRITEPR